MKFNKKRGFTIVELIIVIAVIAVLAAVLIPTFGGLINNAQEAKDTANVRMLNQALRADTSVNKHDTMHQAIAAAQNHGIDVTRLTATVPGNVILWDSENDLFAYYKVGEKGEIGEISYIPEFKPASKLQTAYKFWKVSKDVADLKGSYSVYWNGDNMTTAEVTVGFDAGVAEVGEVKYLRTTGDAQSVIIRTNGGSLTVNAPADSVSHYGKASKVDVVAVAGATYNEYGQVGYMQVASGRVVVDSASDVKVGAVLVVAAQNGNANSGVKLEVNKSDVQVAKESEAKVNEIVVNGTAVTDVATSTKDEMETKYGTFANGDGSEANPYQIATASDLENLSTYTNNGKLVDKHYVLVADIDLQGKAFVPIGTKDHPFKGTFDGKGHTVKNFAINWVGKIDGAGLFGFAEGEVNTLYSQLSDVWNTEKSLFSEEKIAANKYTTVIKNVSIAGLTMTTTTDGRYAGAVVGIARNIYIVNCRVSDTTIVGYKGIGGIVGSLDGSVVKNCNTANDVSISSIADGYNVGGIVGGTAYAYSSNILSSAIINCENNATVRMDTTASTGYIGGVVGLAQASKCDVIVGCKNYGELYVSSNGSEQYGPIIAGIAGQCNSVKLIYDCTNAGKISASDSYDGIVAGIGGYTQNPIEVNSCVNTVSITAHAKQVAGLMGNLAREELLTCKNSSNAGTLKNTNNDGQVAEICTSIQTYKVTNENFANVAALNQRLANATGRTIVLVDVSVENKADCALVIPANIIQFSSNTEVAERMDYTKTADGLTLTAQKMEITLKASKLAQLTVDGQGNKVVLEENASISRLTVKGRAALEIKGEVSEALYIGGNDTIEVTIAEKGVVDSVRFVGEGTYNFTNHGVISHETSSESRNQHTIYALSQCNVTINNHGTIEATGTNPSYALLFYGHSTVVFNAYSGSEVRNTCEKGYLLACHLADKVTFNVQVGAKLLQANNKELDYKILASKNATVTEMK